MPSKSSEQRFAFGRVRPVEQRPRERPAPGESATSLSDATLVRRVGFGYTDALAELYERHGTTVYTLAQRLLGPMPAVEVTRAVFLLLWSTPGVFDMGEGSLRQRLLEETSALSYDILGSAPPGDTTPWDGGDRTGAGPRSETVSIATPVQWQGEVAQ